MSLRRARRVTLVLAFLAPAALAQTPKGQPQPVKPEDVQKLKQQIQQETSSFFDLIVGGHGESGDLNNDVGHFSYGAKLDLHVGTQGRLRFTGLHTRYSTQDSVLDETATRFGAGYENKTPGGLEYQAELDVLHFGTGTTTVGGLGSLRLKPSEKLRLGLTVARSGVEESLLSAAGMLPVEGPFAAQRVGPVLENRAAVNGSYQLPWRLDLFAEGGLGSRSGENVDSNGFRRALGGVGFGAITAEEGEPVSLLRLSASVFYFGFDDDRLGFGGASLLDAFGQPVPVDRLGSDGISPVPSPGNPGVGGYFSPHSFVSTVGRVDVRGRFGTSVDYEAYGFAGVQSYTDTTSKLAAGVWGRLTFRLGDRFALPVQGGWDDYGPFTQESFEVRLRVRF
jgi:hypothetical protein